ncbi:MAG: ribonuclease P protein component [Candidatus Vogelbacteria bacterium]|nr:ribonuclease P protein component [Candidatus Vogelbacteria bacterium]
MGINKKIFTEILKSGKILHSNTLSLRFIQPPKNVLTLPNQYLFVVSLKVSKLATERNLLKRRSRDIINKHKNLIKKPLICVFFFKPAAINLNYNELNKEIVMILKQARLIK